MRVARAVAVAPILLYSRVISPAIPRHCKYEPTCSRYAVEAIREYGILKGLVLAGWRLLRCNPWSYGGYDPVQAQRVFRISHHGGVGAALGSQLHSRVTPSREHAPSDNPPEPNVETH